MTNINIHNFVMVINISIHDSVKNYSCHNVLTFIQMCKNENKFSQTRSLHRWKWMRTGKKRQNDYVSCKHKCIQINSQ